jgi:hypothetical protein
LSFNRRCKVAILVEQNLEIVGWYILEGTNLETLRGVMMVATQIITAFINKDLFYFSFIVLIVDTL